MAVPRSYVGILTFAHQYPNIIILDFSHTEANEPSAWNDRLWAHQLICLLTCNCSGIMAVSLTGTASLTLPTKSQLTAWNNTADELNTRLSLGKGTLRQFFES